MAAASLASEIQSAGGNQFAAAIRYHTAPFGPTFIQDLDILLAERHPRASPFAPLNSGDVVEIQGESATGKTQMLLHLAMVTALPSEASFQIHTPDAPSLLDEVVEIGGKGQAVAIFDLDGRWDTHRLASMMRSHYERRTQEHVQDGREQIRQGQVSSKEIEAKVEAALTRILLFQPTSLVALAASLRNLSTQADELLLPSDNLSLVLIDSISATLFQDRWDMEQAKQAAEVTPPTNANKSNDAPPPMPTQHPIRYVLRALGALRQERGITTFMTSAAFTPLTAKSRFYRPAVPPPYPSPFAEDAPKQTKFCSDDPCSSLGIPLPITHHITMHAMPIPQLPKSTTRHQIFGDEGQKRGYTAENQQVLRGFLRVAGVGAVSQDGSAFAGTFDMRVTAAGLEA